MKYSIYSKLMFILLLSMSFTACDDDDDAPVACNTIAITGGNEQVSISEGSLSDPLQVTVTNADGQPVSNATVTWAVASGGGTVAPATSTTNAQGIAETVWTFGPDNGTVRATIDNPASCTTASTVEFTSEKIQLTLNQTGTRTEPVRVNGNCYLFNYIIATTSNADLSGYFIDVEIEAQYESETTPEFFYNIGTQSTDRNSITFEDCYAFGTENYIDEWFTIRIFNMEDIVDDEPVEGAEPILTSNRIGPVRTMKPEGSPRLTNSTSKMEINRRSTRR